MFNIGLLPGLSRHTKGALVLQSTSFILYRNLGSISPTCLQEAFMRADPKSIKIQSSCLSVSFCAFGIYMRKSFL
jgi:hypothetical protein